MKILLLLTIINTGYYVSCSNLTALSDDDIAYSSNLYKVLAERKDTSFLISPLSLKIALGLLAYGANGNTYDQLLQALLVRDVTEVGVDVVKLHNLPKKSPLSIANAFYIDNHFTVKPPYYQTVVEVFRSQIESVDFSESAKVANKLNRWVKGKTHGKIKHIVSENDFNNETSLALINALYFHDKWMKQFRQASTRPQIFHKNSTVDIAVDMMNTKLATYFRDSQELNAKFIQLPYKHSDFAMYVVIPKDIDGIKRLEARIQEVLSAELYFKIDVHLQLPKFKARTTIDLIPLLKELGVYDAFDVFADFTKMTDEFVAVRKIIQKSVIEVDEKGTTTDSATADIVVAPVSAKYPKPVEFVADRPFIYYIKYKDEVLFVGRYI